MSIIYSKSSGFANAAIGKLETPIKMVIEHESDLLRKKGGIADKLFNIEKSNRFGETIVGESEFGLFHATAEGAAATADTIRETYTKFIEHIQFMKEFTITAEMMEDAAYGIAADAKHRAESFTRAYYKTMHRICEQALASATNASATIAGAEIDLTAPDGKPLFSGVHYFGDGTFNEQSNLLYSSAAFQSAEAFEAALGKLSARLRSMRDENGEPLGYAADTLILPGNHPTFESIVKKVCGTPGSLGNGYNDMNLEYGRWNVVVLPNWQPADKRIMVMSSEANIALRGNMFFNRVPLTVTNFVDNHTGNYIWNGRCRFGVGFGSYKHILLCVEDDALVTGATPLG